MIFEIEGVQYTINPNGSREGIHLFIGRLAAT